MGLEQSQGTVGSKHHRKRPGQAIIIILLFSWYMYNVHDQILDFANRPYRGALFFQVNTLCLCPAHSFQMSLIVPISGIINSKPTLKEDQK